jgi:hypothetical protein
LEGRSAENQFTNRLVERSIPIEPFVASSAVEEPSLAFAYIVAEELELGSMASKRRSRSGQEMKTFSIFGLSSLCVLSSFSRFLQFVFSGS